MKYKIPELFKKKSPINMFIYIPKNSSSNAISSNIILTKPQLGLISNFLLVMISYIFPGDQNFKVF